MKTYIRLLKFARSLGRYIAPYSICVVLYSFFNMMTFTLIIPVINALFNGKGSFEAVTSLPPVKLSVDYLQEFMGFVLYKVYGPDFTITQVLIFLSLMVITAALLGNLFRYLSQRMIENIRISTMENLRNTMFDSVMKLNVGYFSNERKGNILSKITSDVQTVQYCVTASLQAFFKEPIIIIGFLVLMLGISVKLTAFTVLVLPVIVLFIGAIVKRLRRKATRAQEALGDMTTVVDESISGIKVIKGYNATGYTISRYRSINTLYSKILRSMAARQQLASPVSETLGISAVAIVLIYGGTLIAQGEFSGAEFIAYLGAFSQVTRPVKSIADAFANINSGLAAGERVFDLIDTEPTITDAPDAIELPEFRESIEFRNVSFSYENRLILDNISFEIKKGETVALAGPSGGGKSTIADLLPRFYDVQQGQILVDGIDIRRYKMESLRSHFGIVAQDTVLFNDTIAGNIMLGNPDAAPEEVEAAAKIANAHAFILETEEGYNTNIGDRGMKLSGGQRQRLSIARAVLKNPDILIMDEATSALDTESERLVQDALDKLLQNRTSLVIAHRLSTIQHADKIIVVNQGRISEQGTHQELVARNGIYNRLIEMQKLK